VRRLARILEVLLVFKHLPSVQAPAGAVDEGRKRALFLRPRAVVRQVGAQFGNMGRFHSCASFRDRRRGRKAASKPKRAAVRHAAAAHGGSGRACHAVKVLSRHYPIQQKKFSVLYSCKRFKAFLGRAVGLATRTCLACSLHPVTPSERSESRGLAVRMSERQRPQRDSSTRGARSE